jgi:pimeloyl-ACP methyl ester carboxylesterase
MNDSKVFMETTNIGGAGLPVPADIRSSHPGDKLPVVIVCPGFLAYKGWGFFPWISEELSRCRLHVVTISFSHSGTDQSTGQITRPEEFAANKVSLEIEDLARVLEYVRSSAFPLSAARRWGLLGHSRGGAVCILTAPRFEEVRSIVTWSALSKLDRYTEERKIAWKKTGALVFKDARSTVPLRLEYGYYRDIKDNSGRYDLIRAAAALGMPHLVVHGERDAAVSPLEAENLVSLPRPAEVKLEIIRGCGHTYSVTHPMKSPSQALEKALGITTEWFERTLHR